MVNLDNYADLENLLKVLKYVVDHSIGLGVNLQVLTRFYLNNLLHVDSSNWNREYRRAYMRLYRFFKSLSKDKYVELYKSSGLIWVKATNRTVDLIFYARKTQTRKSTRKRLNEFKFEARKYVEHKHRLTPRDWLTLFDDFAGYLEDTRNKVLVFLSPDRKVVVKRYSHRFQQRQLKKIAGKFDRIFENASKKYKSGIFLTLTLDPKTYRSISEGVKRAAKAWNRFMSRLRKKFGFRPPYIKVLEFQNNGNPHYHIILFGVDSIGDHYDLTEYLKKIGFGEIHFEYQIANRKGKWVWKNPKKKPTKLRNDGVKDYLKKYIKKAFDYPPDSISIGTDNIEVEDLKISMYFALDTRFFTYSRVLYKAVYPVREYGWVYIGSYKITEFPDWLYNRILTIDWGLDPPPIISQIIEYNEVIF